MGEFDPGRDPVPMWRLNNDPLLMQEFLRKGGEEPHDVRATPAACILVPPALIVAGVLWVAFGLWFVAVGVVVLVLALNLWSGIQGQRNRDRNERILMEILREQQEC